MVAVDSSVWIEFFRGKDDALVEEVRRLLDGDQIALMAPVRLELLSGATRTESPRLRRLFSALPLLLPGPDVWDTLEAWVTVRQRSGQRFGAMDLLIAGIAAQHDATIWSRDADFKRMAKLGWVQLHLNA